MKRILCLIATFLFLANADAQYQGKKGLGAFNEIEVSGSSDLTLYQSDSNYLVVPSVDEMADVLHVHIKAGVLYITSGFKGDLYVKNIVAIRTTDASSVTCNDTLKEDVLKVSATDASRIKIFVHAKTVAARSRDAGEVIIAGTTDLLEAKASDASHINTYGLKAGAVKAVAADGSLEELYAENSIDASATDGSNITVKGSPKQRNISAADGGSVKMSDLGEQAIPEYGRHSMGTILDDDSIWGKKHSNHHFGEGFIGGGFVSGGNKNAPIQYGASREFILGFGGGYKFLKWNAIGWDIYYKSTGYYFLQNSSKGFPDTLIHSAQKISLQNFGGLVYDRFIFASGYHGQLSLDLGFYFDWTFNSREVTWDNSSNTKIINRDLSITSPTNYGVTARLVFLRGLSCYFNYRLSNAFKFTDPYAPTLPACVVGVTIGLGD